MIKLDRINKIILQEVVSDGRISNIDLAMKVGLSPSACLRRVQDLESSGVIRGYSAQIDRQLLGFGFKAFTMVGLGEHTKQSQEQFEKAIAEADEVKDCHNVTGSFEYILRVETRDLSDYKRFHTDVLGVLPQVSTITTHVVMESTKTGPP